MPTAVSQNPDTAIQQLRAGVDVAQGQVKALLAVCEALIRTHPHRDIVSTALAHELNATVSVLEGSGNIGEAAGARMVAEALLK